MEWGELQDGGIDSNGTEKRFTQPRVKSRNRMERSSTKHEDKKCKMSR